MREDLQRIKVVGIKQTNKAIKSGKASVVYIAKEAEARVTKPLEDMCEQNGVEIIFVDTMKELGHMCGIDVGAAAAALIND